MIELIFAIVIVAIVMLTIPMIIRVMNQSQELSLGQEIFAKMYAQAQRKSMNPWDQSVSRIVLNPEDTNGTILIVNDGSADLNCSRLVGTTFYRVNNISSRECNQAFLAASAIPAQDNNLSGMWGIEQYNDEAYIVQDTLNGNYEIRMVVAYVNDGAVDAVHNGRYATTWQLGNSSSPSGATAAANATHLKRVVMRFTRVDNNGIPIATMPVTTFTYFMSNIGVVQ